MRLSRALQEKIMDVRLRDKLIGEGKISKEQVQKYLDSLSDDTKNATWTEAEEEHEEE